jgi:hypothetical protein
VARSTVFGFVAGAALLLGCRNSGATGPTVGAHVSSVTVTPNALPLAVGDTGTLTATLRDSTGTVVSGPAVSWATSDSSRATVSSGGLVRAVGEGTALVSATSQGKADTAAVTVTAPSTAPVDSVAVTPSAVTLGVGDTAHLAAWLFDSAGAVLTGRAVAWTTSDPGVARVSTAGVVTGVAAGTAAVAATSEGRADTAAVTVTTGGAGVNECASPGTGWIWCDDFEQNRLSSYFEYDNAGGDFVRAAGVGLNGSYGMRARWSSAGQVSAGSLHLAFGKTPQSYFRAVDAGTQIYRDIYWRMYVRRAPGWTGGGGDKLSRAIVFASSSSWAEAIGAHVWSGTSPGPTQSYLTIDPASGTDAAGNLTATGYNDFNRWLGQVTGTTPMYSDATAGTWYCVEAHVKLNDAGQSNGVFQLWIDGSLEAQETGMNWLGSFSSYGINAVFFENYWNAGAPKAEERYFDNLVVSTQRIGC